MTARTLQAAALIILAACQRSPATADQRNDTTGESAFPSTAPGMQWVREVVPRFCERPLDTARAAEPRIVRWPDSADALAAARRLLGARASREPVIVKNLLRTSDGVFIKFADTSANVRDGSVSVYVTPGPCVAWLGW